MSFPTVKLISVESPTIAQVPAARSLREKRSPLPPTGPADLRWSRVEEYFRSRELRPNTRKSYERAFKAFLTWTDKGWQDITARDIDRYKTHLKEQPSLRGGQRKAATINLALSALQSIFKWLCARDYIGKDPMLLIEKPKPDPVVPQEWSPAEVKALLEATAQRGETALRDRALLWILLHGLRAGEVEALNLGDFDGKRVRIRQAKDDSVGQVPLLPEAIGTLENYLNLRCDRGAGGTGESPLFLSESNNSKGQRLSYWGIYKVVKELAAIAGVKDAHPHQGRHTVATEMVSRGMNPLLARQITRHKSEKSFERYSQRALQQQAEAQFLQVFADQGRWREQGGRGLESEIEATLSPVVTLTEPSSSSLRIAKVGLRLQVIHSDPSMRRKLRRVIESTCLARYEREKAGRGDLLLTIPYEDDADLAWQIDWLRGEMAELAEGVGGAIEVEMQEGDGRNW